MSNADLFVNKGTAVVTPLKLEVLKAWGLSNLNSVATLTELPEKAGASGYAKGIHDALYLLHESSDKVVKNLATEANVVAKVAKKGGSKKVFVIGIVVGVVAYKVISDNIADVKKASNELVDDAKDKFESYTANNTEPVAQNLEQLPPEDGQL